VIRLLLYVVVIVAVIHVVRRYFTVTLKPAVQVTPQGIAVSDAFGVSWSEIRQVDVCRMPTSGAAEFSVVLFGNSALTVTSAYRNFDLFAARMIERWPQIETEWMRVRRGPPEISERVTVWKKD